MTIALYLDAVFPNIEFPVDCSRLMLAYLDPLSLLVCSAVSRTFQQLTKDEMLWKAIASSKGIPLSSGHEVKKQVKEYCFKYTQLFWTLFSSEMELPRNKLLQYDVMKAYLALHPEAIQGQLDACIDTASLETVLFLTQLGAKVEESPIYGLIEKIKHFSMHDSSLCRRFKFSSAIVLSEHDRQSFRQSLQVLEIFMQAGGKIQNSRDDKSLIRIALKYHSYQLAISLLSPHANSFLWKIPFTEFLNSVLSKDNAYRSEELPHLKQVIELLASSAEIPDDFAQRLQEIGIDAESLKISKTRNPTNARL